MQRHNSDQQVEYTDKSRLLENDKRRSQTQQNGSETVSSVRWWHEIRPYNVYVLLLLLLAYLLNQLDRYMLAVTILPVAQEIKFGDQGCLKNLSVHTTSTSLKCNGTNQDSCMLITDSDNQKLCMWDYNGQGWAYLILAGPIFILIYTFAGIFIGFAADHYNRKLFLAVCLTFWSAMTLLTGFVKDYWQLAVLRFGLGLGEAGCTPFASSLISDYFSESLRGTALGVYNFGVYFGYSLAFAVGNFITLANINGQSWRWAFIIPGIPGIALGVLIAFSMREPDRNGRQRQQKQELEDSVTTPVQRLALMTVKTQLLTILKVFLCPSLLLLCLAGSIRNAAGYVLAYNSQLYFEASNVPKEIVGSYMSWIPLVGGSIGALGGGFISDRVVKKWGLYARVSVLVASQLLAAPFAAGVLFLDAPYAFISLIPAYIIGEMWISVTLTVAVELVPSQIRTSAVAVYLFIITNIGGNLPLLVPPIASSFESNGYNQLDALRGALYILYPGLFILGGLLFLLTMLVVKRDQQRAQFEVVIMEDP